MGATIAQLVVEVGADVDGALRGLQRVQGRISGMARSAGQAAAALAPVSAALGAVGAIGIRAFTEYEDSLAELVARTGLYGDELEQVEALAMRMGQTTQFSATQAVDAMLQLVSSGQSVADAMQTLPNVLTLAAVSGMDLGTTADALTDVLAMFSLQVGDAAEVVDVLAAAEGASSATVASLVDALANVGPVARQYGIDIETTSAALAVLSENGIKGAEAGTALKSMLLNMTRPTEDVTKAWQALGTSFYDAEGQARPLPDILEDIRAGLADKTPEEANEILKNLAGSYGLIAMNALLGEQSVTDMLDAMSGQSSAAEIAAAKTNTLSGSMKRLQNSVRATLIQAMRPFIEQTLRPLVENVSGVVAAIGRWVDANPALTSTIVTAGAAVVGLTAILGMASLALAGVSAAIGALMSPITLVIALVAALGYAISHNILGLGDLAKEVAAWFTETIGAVKSAFDTAGLEGAAAVLLGRLLAGLGDVVEWTRVHITEPMLEALRTTDWSTLGRELLSAVLAGLGDVAEWTRAHITEPMLETLRGVDWLEAGRSILETMLAGLGNMVEWTSANIASPILETIRGVDWLGVGRAIIETMMAGFGDMAMWTLTNIVRPLVATIQVVDWSTVGQSIIDAVLVGIGDMVTWTSTHITLPILEAIRGADWATLGREMLSAMLNGLGNIVEWTLTNIVRPIIATIQVVDWSVAGRAIIDAMLAGLGDMVAWAFTNIVKPILDTLLSGDTLGQIANAAATVGRTIFDALIDALAGLPRALVSLINSAIPNEIDLGTVRVPDLGPLGGGYSKQITIDIPDNPIPAFGAGGIVTKPTLALVGERGPEAIVPLTGHGAGVGGVTITGPIYVQGVQDAAGLLVELERIARRRGQRLMQSLERA